MIRKFFASALMLSLTMVMTENTANAITLADPQPLELAELDKSKINAAASNARKKKAAMKKAEANDQPKPKTPAAAR